MPDRGAQQTEGEAALTTDKPPPDVLVFPGPQVPVTTYVDGFGWRCCVCGWVGTDLTSVGAAQNEAGRHMQTDHPDMETVNVELLQR